MELLYERTYRVASHTVGPNGLVRPSALLGFLEDAAGEHAASRQLSLEHLLPRGLMWVLTRYHLRVLRPPRYGEELRVTTWPSARGPRLALRDFEVHAATGEPLAVATTAWAILDVATRRPRPVGDVVPAGFVLDRRALQDDLLPLPPLAEPQHELTLPVMLRDLDMNRHVNHAVYLQWALEAVPREHWSAGPPHDIEIAYLGEARLGDAVVSALAALPDTPTGPAFAHRITRAGSGRELARLRTGWSH